MNKETLAQFLLDFHQRPFPDLIERELDVPLELPLKRAITIMGPRRGGKTYYLFCLIQNQCLKLENYISDRASMDVFTL